MRGIYLLAVVLISMGSTAGSIVRAPSLKGSRSSVEKMHREALRHDFTFIKDAGQLHKFVKLGLLVPVPAGSNHKLDGVSFPFARPATKLFILRLSKQYKSSCGEGLVITSLTRPTKMKVKGGSPVSVHPTGMALDIRVSQKRSCRTWLEQTLMSLENKGVLEATREYKRPHYHVAVFSRQYSAYISSPSRK